MVKAVVAIFDADFAYDAAEAMAAVAMSYFGEDLEEITLVDAPLGRNYRCTKCDVLGWAAQGAGWVCWCCESGKFLVPK